MGCVLLSQERTRTTNYSTSGGLNRTYFSGVNVKFLSILEFNSDLPERPTLDAARLTVVSSAYSIKEGDDARLIQFRVGWSNRLVEKRVNNKLFHFLTSFVDLLFIKCSIIVTARQAFHAKTTRTSSDPLRYYADPSVIRGHFLIDICGYWSKI
jgi:hypothetical protein